MDDALTRFRTLPLPPLQQAAVDSASVSRASLPGPSRLRLALALLALPLLVGAILRTALAIGWRGECSPGQVLASLALGLPLDLAVALLAASPLLLAVLASRAPMIDGAWARRVLLTLWVFAIGFLAAAEWCFFSEFTARFNHIALDYLIYPHEVFVNIWESYNVPVIVGGLLAVSAAAAWPVAAWTRAPAVAPRRRVALPALAGLLAVSAGAVWLLPERPTGNRIADGIAQNGVVQVARAFGSASLEYERYYRAPLPAAAEAAASARFGLAVPHPGAAPRKAVGAAAPAADPYDVLVVLEESLGQEFVGALGGPADCTPQLDRWSKEGLLLTNLVANGNRTVRGLEGVLCGYLPLPPDSLVKRDNHDLATIATVLARRGYAREFFYGGVGSFDHMGPFALANGWQEFHDDPLVGASPYPASDFRTAWGVADGFVFDQLLARQRAAREAGQRLFSTLLTVSNHKPFLVPGAAGRGPSSKDIIRALAIGGTLLVLTGAGWWWRRRVGLLPLGMALVPLWLGFAVFCWVRLGSDESRETAVRYADASLGRYLDQAKAAGILDHTVVLVVGDHGARVYGSQAMPLDSYRIPGLFLTPGGAPARIDRLCSQVDLAPTLLSLAGISAEAPFIGDDLTRTADQPGRAFVQHNRDIGMLTDDALVVLGLQGSVTCYRRPPGPAVTAAANGAVVPAPLTFTPVPPAEAAADPRLSALIVETEAAFAWAYYLERDGRWRLPDPTP